MPPPERCFEHVRSRNPPPGQLFYALVNVMLRFVLCVYLLTIKSLMKMVDMINRWWRVFPSYLSNSIQTVFFSCFPFAILTTNRYGFHRVFFFPFALLTANQTFFFSLPPHPPPLTL